MAIRITPEIEIPENEIQETFIRVGGPGGQKVNKTSTGVQIRFDVENSPSLPDDVRDRLIGIAGNRISQEGHLVIEASRFRTQERNRHDAIERLVNLIRQAAQRPKVRKKTTPSAQSSHRRLKAKQRRAEIKALRRRIVDDDEE